MRPATSSPCGTTCSSHDYGQYARDAENAALNEIARFFRRTTKTAPGPPGRTSCITGTEQAGKAAQ
jgi:hypothetical protein